MSAIITVQNVEKSFGTRRVLGGVSFAIHERDRIGLVGVNGSGKSTLLRLVVTATTTDTNDQPDAGLITRQRDLTLEYVPQEPLLAENRTIRETLQEGLRDHARTLGELASIEARLRDGGLNEAQLHAALGSQAALHEKIETLGGWDREHEIRGLAASLLLPPLDTLVSTLSGGQRRRVALARALLARPGLLALDEPTNHLDTNTVEWLEERLQNEAGALLLVTHDRYFLDRVATRILELDRGRLYAYEGNYSNFLEKQAERLETASAKEQARASFVRRELDWIRRGPKARGTKQKARIDRFNVAVAAKPTASERRLGEMELRLGSGGRLGKTILELRGISKTLGEQRLFHDLNLVLKPGDHIGVVGPNGAGKTTLVRVLVGELKPDAGEVVVGLNTRIAFLDQGRAELNSNHTVLEEVAGDADHVFLADGPVHVRTFLRMMLFDDQFADTPIATLSGGERNRVQLAKLLRANANLLVLDEPTNDLDVMTLGVLEETLSSFPGCAFIVSHDRWFLDKVATGILAFENNGEVVFYEGNYSSYAARRTAAQVSQRETTVIASKPPVAAPAPTSRRLNYKEKLELAGMEAAITAAEQNLAKLQATLNDPSIYKERPTEVPALIGQLDAARSEIERLYQRWQELEALER